MPETSTEEARLAEAVVTVTASVKVFLVAVVLMVSVLLNSWEIARVLRAAASGLNARVDVLELTLNWVYGYVALSLVDPYMLNGVDVDFFLRVDIYVVVFVNNAAFYRVNCSS